MLCPEGTGLLTTQPYDSYQWYQRYYGSGTTAFILSGETSQTLSLNYFDHAASYFTVEVTQGSQTATSPEFFVDGWAFLPPTVMTTGEFTIGDNGETIICEGDTVYFELMQPYTTNIVWYNDGIPIGGESGQVLEVTAAGNYTVSGAPEVCPDWEQQLGVTLEVDVINCTPGGITEADPVAVQLSPNPAADFVTVSHPSAIIDAVAIYDSAGQLVKEITSGKMNAVVAIDDLENGFYFVVISLADQQVVESLVVK